MATNKDASSENKAFSVTTPYSFVWGFGSISCVSQEAPTLVPAHCADLFQTLTTADMERAQRGSPGDFQAVIQSPSCRVILTQ